MIESRSAEVRSYWERCKEQLGLEDEAYHACTFADTALSRNVDMIGNLAVTGQKKATAHLLLDFERNGVPRRAPGEHWVVLGSALMPLCLVGVSRVEVVPFDQVGEDTAIAEGEGDLSLEHWATVHRRYFVKQCALWNVAWREDLPTVCEYFDLIAPASDASEAQS